MAMPTSTDLINRYGAEWYDAALTNTTSRRGRDQKLACQLTVQSALGYQPRESDILDGQTIEQIIADCKRRQSMTSKRAGAQALKSKYGTDAAQRILERKTGRHIAIQ